MGRDSPRFQLSIVLESEPLGEVSEANVRGPQPEGERTLRVWPLSG
jgi:hypothetical protein